MWTGGEGDFPTHRASSVLWEVEKHVLWAAGDTPQAGRQQAMCGPWGLDLLTWAGCTKQSPGPCLLGGWPARLGSLLKKLLPTMDFGGRQGAVPAYLLSPAASRWNEKEVEGLKRLKCRSVVPLESRKMTVSWNWH